jgi:hypothetical protein
MMKAFICAAVMAMVLTMLAGAAIEPVFGQEMDKSQDSYAPKATPRGDAMFFDFVFLRPLGIVASGFGIATSVVITPFALIASGSTGGVYKALVVDPLRYTFRRPLGDLENDYQKQ